MLRAALSGNLAPGPDMLQRRRAFTDRYFYGADGHVSERVLTAVAELGLRWSNPRV
jgi:hypothetical protein